MLQEFKHSCKLMGNIFEFTVVAGEPDIAYTALDVATGEVRRIEKLFTSFSDSSETYAINAAAGIAPVPVSKEVYALIERSMRISQVTDGAFDLSYGSIDKKLWNFDRSMTELPDASLAKQLVHLVDYRNIELNPSAGTVFLKKKGMRIGFGGIGKGYAADRAAHVLQELGIRSGLVNASGDIKAWGLQANGEAWTIGISHPDEPGKAFSYVQLRNNAIATSGNYEKYVTIDGKKYSHTINPKTGMPVTGIKSVTIIAPNAELADAIATPVTIMGVKAGLAIINQVPELACVIIDDNNHIYSSNNINQQ